MTLDGDCPHNSSPRTLWSPLFHVTGHCRCCHTLHIWNNIILGEPFWKISYYILGWIPVRKIPVGYSIPLDMALFHILWEVIADLVDNPLPELLYFPIWSLLNEFSITTFYEFVRKGSSWDLSLLSAVSHHFESTSSRYSILSSWTSDSWVMCSLFFMAYSSHALISLIKPVTYLCLLTA